MSAGPLTRKEVERALILAGRVGNLSGLRMALSLVSEAATLSDARQALALALELVQAEGEEGYLRRAGALSPKTPAEDP